MIKLLYFAALVDRLGTAGEALEASVADNVRDVGSLVILLKQRGGAWQEVFGAGSVRMTVNKKFAELNTPIQDGDEIAFISAWI